MLVPGLQNKSLLTMASGSNAVLSNVHESLCECAREMLGKYRKQLESTGDTGKKEKLTIKARATEILLNELCNVPKDSAATSETIASALECHVKALQNHEHLLSKKGNTYALMQQTRALRKGHGDAPAELAPLLQYHDLKDKLLASDSPLSAEKKEVITMLDTRKGLTLTVLEGMDELSRAEATGRLSYVYNGRNFPLQGSSGRGLPENFICCICRNIINQPREVCPESHITCLECAINLKERENAVCPQCRKSPLAKLKESTAIERSIGNLQVHCCNEGCRSVMPISEIKSHLGLCDEEKIECPGKCIDESTNEVLHMPRKQVADHITKCPKHFRCDNCAECFPYRTETKYLELYRNHVITKHGAAENTSSGFVANLVDEFLSLQTLLQRLQKQAVTQAGRAEPQTSSIDWNKYGPYRFTGINCIRTQQDGVYQSLKYPLKFFITLEAPPGQEIMHRVKLYYHTRIELLGRMERMDFDVYFYLPANNREYQQRWKIQTFSDSSRECLRRTGGEEGLRYILVAGYTGNEQELKRSLEVEIKMNDYAYIESMPYEGNRYFFQILI